MGTKKFDFFFKKVRNWIWLVFWLVLKSWNHSSRSQHAPIYVDIGDASSSLWGSTSSFQLSFRLYSYFIRSFFQFLHFYSSFFTLPLQFLYILIFVPNPTGQYMGIDNIFNFSPLELGFLCLVILFWPIIMKFLFFLNRGILFIISLRSFIFACILTFFWNHVAQNCRIWMI